MSPHNWPLHAAVVLTTLITGRPGGVNWGVLKAGVLVAMIPCLVIFLLLQRYCVRGRGRRRDQVKPA